MARFAEDFDSSSPLSDAPSYLDSLAHSQETPGLTTVVESGPENPEYLSTVTRPDPSNPPSLTDSQRGRGLELPLTPSQSRSVSSGTDTTVRRLNPTFNQRRATPIQEEGMSRTSTRGNPSNLPLDNSGNPLSGDALLHWIARDLQQSRVQENRDTASEDSPVDSNGSPLTGEALTRWVVSQWSLTRRAMTNATEVAVSKPKATAKDIGYFYPRYIKSNETRPTTDFMVDVGDTVYYTSVAAFEDRLQDMIVAFGSQMIKQQVIQCLKGEAATWYSQELGIEDKMTIRDDQSTNLIQICTRLKRQFRTNTADAYDKFYGSTYTPRDAQLGRHLRDFVSTKHLQGREAGLSTDHLTPMIHALVDPSFQVCMMIVDDTTTFQDYRRHCEIKGDLFIKNARGSLYGTPTFSQRRGYGTTMQPPPVNSSTPATRGFVPPSSSSNKLPRGQGSGNAVGPDGRSYPNPQNLSRPCRHCAQTNKIVYHKDNECPSQARTYQQPRAVNWMDMPQYEMDLTEQYHNPTGPFNVWTDEPSPAQEGTAYTFDVPQFSYDDAQAASADTTPVYHQPRARVTEPDDSSTSAKESLRQIKGTGSTSAPLSETDDLRHEKSDLVVPDEGDESIINVAVDHLPINSVPLSQPECHMCRTCSKSFRSENSLFQHIRVLKHYLSISAHWMSTPLPEAVDWKIYESCTNDAPGFGLRFKDFDYAKIKTRFSPNGWDNLSCLDTGTALSSIDCSLVTSDMHVQRLDREITVGGLGGVLNKSVEFVMLSLYLPGQHGQMVKLATHEFHIVDKLDCGMLVGNDVAQPEGIIVDVGNESASLKNAKDESGCPISIPLSIIRTKMRYLPVVERVHCLRDVVILPGATSFVEIEKVKKIRKDVLYKFVPKPIAIGAQAVDTFFDTTTPGVLFVNRSGAGIHLQKGSEVGLCTEWDPDEHATRAPVDQGLHFLTLAEQHSSITLRERRGDVLRVTAQDPVDNESTFLRDCFIYRAAREGKPEPTASDIESFFNDSAKDGNVRVVQKDVDEKPKPKEKPFGSKHVTVNSDECSPAQQAAFRKILEDHEVLFQKELGRVNEPEEDWLEIPIRPGESLKSPGVYKASQRDKEVIDKTFDELRSQGLLNPGKGPVGWPVFVVWKNGKGRAVVDLRGLNAATIADAYPLPSQEEIMALLKDCRWITCIDVRSSFYQRMVKRSDRYKFTVVLHRGQEEFGVAVMGFCNSPAHGQRLMDRLLDGLPFVKCYVDDVVIFSRTFEEHLEHLRIVLGILRDAGLTLAPEKCFVGFHKVELLGHVVDRFGLYTQPQKTKAISNIDYPKTLTQLEHWVGLTGYYRHFVPYYSRLMRPLQELKNKLLSKAPAGGQPRTQFCLRQEVPSPNPAQLESFELMKAAICSSSVLIHHDCSIPVVYRLDASYEHGFGCIVLQVPRDVMLERNLTDEDIMAEAYDRKLERPILYLSREISNAEQNYWPTELETQACVWAVQKTRHIIEQNPKVLMFTDHQAIVAMSKMRSLKTQSTDRQNKKLIRASQFLSQYPHIIVRHVSGISNIGADKLSRLQAKETLTSSEAKMRHLRSQVTDDEDVDTSYIFVSTVCTIESDLKQRISEGYDSDPQYKGDLAHYKALIATERKTSPECNQVTFAQFTYRKDPETSTGLIFFEDPLDGRLRLCLPRNVWKDVFRQAHDCQNHASIDRAVRMLRLNFYIKGMYRELEAYCSQCPSCEINTTKRHAPYGLLQPIRTPNAIWEVLTLDFVVKLPKCSILNFVYDSFMSVTDKFSKAIMLVPGCETWTAEAWADAFYRTVWKAWGFPQAMITDRGGQFVSKFWKELFRRAKTRLHLTTAYHAQGDGQSEMSNQIAEIALRHVVNGSQTDWVEFLPFVENAHNNLVNASTGKTPNEILFGRNTRNALDVSLATDVPAAEDFSKNRENIRIEAAEAIQFAQAQMKYNYDKHHKPIDIPIGSFVNIKFSRSMEKGYRPKNVNAPKLGPQRGGRYQVLEKVGKLAYRLDLRDTLPGVHPVFSVEHLEPCAPHDNYDRKPIDVSPVLVNDEEEWEIDEVLAKDIRGSGRNRGIHYLVRWKGFNASEDQWLPIRNFRHAREKIAEFEARRLLLPKDSTFESKLSQLKAKASGRKIVEQVDDLSESDSDSSQSSDTSSDSGDSRIRIVEAANWS